jgi:hypothetical protein
MLYYFDYLPHPDEPVSRDKRDLGTTLRLRIARLANRIP